MRLSLRFIILSGFLLVLLPALILLSYTDFTKAKSNLENNFDFIFLSPVLISKLYTKQTLGWDSFGNLALEANMPVFALGGIRKSDLDKCLSHNGYGVSGITNF